MKRSTNGWTLLMAVPFLTQVAVAQAASCEDTSQQIEAFYNKTVDSCPGNNGEVQAVSLHGVPSAPRITAARRATTTSGKPAPNPGSTGSD